MSLRRTVLISLLTAAACLCTYAATDEEGNAHKMALDLAGAFSNDGFKVRDGYWSGTVAPGEPVLVAVNLFAGNQYWFTAGAGDAAKKIAVDVYDENGQQIVADGYNSGNKAAAGCAPTSSGQYYISVNLSEGQATTVCLLYSYK
ncbi:MAG: hypothetical protein ACR2MF_04615 [Chthoniobacterales bacterium]